LQGFAKALQGFAKALQGFAKALAFCFAEASQNSGYQG